MIVAEHVNKAFGNITALDNVSAEIKKGTVFGLVGTNGAGKSTFLRTLAGILLPDSGAVTIDGEKVFENPPVKQRFFYISDDQYYFTNSTPRDIQRYYAKIYPSFNVKQFDHLMKNFELRSDRKISTFSKGMKKQLSVICAIAAQTDYIFCDETFDGLDPVMRQGVKSLFAVDIAQRELTPIIASHNLRELEDICDHVGLLHRGGILLSRDIDDMKLNIHKIQCVFTEEKKREDFPTLDIISMERRGSLYTIISRGDRDGITSELNNNHPVFSEVLPLTLEEIFISETEVCGYDVKKLLV